MRAHTDTPFAVTSMPALSREGEELAVVVASAAFDWPLRSDTLPSLRGDQAPPAMVDSYYADPERSSMSWEGQSAYTRPGTDIYVFGHAWTPGAEPNWRGSVYVLVGSCERKAAIYGERQWVLRGNELVPSRAQPFTRMALVWEHAFGGQVARPTPRSLAASAQNPIGRGLYDDARGRPLPNIEDPAALIQRVGDRPAPVGFGPIPRHWQPRAAYLGSYDQRWQQTRAPLWPQDMDERMFCAAAPGLCAVPHLRGDELVVLAGLTPEPALRFHLPGVALEANFELTAGAQRRAMVLDAVSIDGDARTLTLIWRASLASRALATLRGITVVRARGSR